MRSMVYHTLFVHMHHWPCHQLHKHRSRIGSSLGFHVQLKVVPTVGQRIGHFCTRPIVGISDIYIWDWLSDTFVIDQHTASCTSFRLKGRDTQNSCMGHNVWLWPACIACMLAAARFPPNYHARRGVHIYI
jgi:hypothetical protein